MTETLVYIVSVTMETGRRRDSTCLSAGEGGVGGSEAKVDFNYKEKFKFRRKTEILLQKRQIQSTDIV